MDNRQSLAQALYFDTLLPTLNEIEEQAKLLTFECLYENQDLTYKQARQEIQDSLDIWIEKYTDYQLEEREHGLN